MKKLILGITLFASGFFGAITLITATVLSPLNPWNYNGIEGWYGVVLGMHLQAPLITSVIIAVVGLIICIIESFQKE